MKLYSHVVTADTGLAPNPFHGYCTTAVCTPSHSNAKLSIGDWLIGHTRKREGHRLIYAMRISDVLTMEGYFADPRFRDKKPKPIGALEEQCGDNFYYKEINRWKRLPSRFHNDSDALKKDLGKQMTGKSVFVAEHFYYFGQNTVIIPLYLNGVINNGQNTKKSYNPLVDDFVTWLEANHTPGIHGRPRDMADSSRDVGPMITDFLADCAVMPANQVAGQKVASIRRSGGGCR